MHSIRYVTRAGLAAFACVVAYAATARAQTPGAYVGESTCLTCHEGQSYKGTAHALTTNGRTPAASISA